MITRGEKIGFIVIAIVAITTFIFWKDIPSFSNAANTEKVKEEKDKKGDKKNGDSNDSEISSQVKVVQKWDLPSVLKEVSGIAYIDDQRFACVQDEEGKIFIFNTALNKIEKEMPFGAPGDYEGITLNGTTAYVVRADGRLFETDMSGAKSDAKEYPTSLTAEQNIEGLCYDKNNNRLLLAIKADEPGKPGYKGIYAFDIATKKFVKEPVFKINMADAAFNTKGGKKNKAFYAFRYRHSSCNQRILHYRWNKKFAINYECFRRHSKIV